VAGKSGIRKITHFDASDLPCQIAGEIPDFDPRDYMSAKDARRLARSSQIAVAAARKAIDDANLALPAREPGRVGVYFGTGIGGFDRGVEGVRVMHERGFHRVNPFSLPSTIPNMPAFHVAKMAKASGPNCTITTACATGTQSVGEAALAIRNGRADIILAGGTEALIQKFALAGFIAMRAMPTSFNENPEKASRPFDLKREGFVFSEGAACLVLESLDHARKRGARIYAQVAGFATSNDGFHIVASDLEAKGAIRTMQWALEDAGVAPGEIDYINAHGTGTQTNDAAETKAIKTVFGKRAYHIPISSTKSMLGHAMGASGAIEAAVSVLTIEHDMIHPTINYVYPDPDLDLDYVPNQSRKKNVRAVLSNSFGLGSQNACLVIRACRQK
jgi:beta-ketoacyl-acyl-carrier-protein synthase II